MIQGLIGYIFASRPELIALLAVSNNDKKLYHFLGGETNLFSKLASENIKQCRRLMRTLIFLGGGGDSRAHWVQFFISFGIKCIISDI